MHYFILTLHQNLAMSKKTFIVPHDFTKIGDIALEHAIATAKPLDAKVYLLQEMAKQNQIHEQIL